MAWTTQPPKESGFYWYRGAYDAGCDPHHIVIYVSDAEYCGMRPALRGWQPFMDYASEIESFTGEWWDEPIPVPPAI